MELGGEPTTWWKAIVKPSSNGFGSHSNGTMSLNQRMYLTHNKNGETQHRHRWCFDAEMTAERRVQTRQPQQNRAYMPLGYLKFANPLSHKTKWLPTIIVKSNKHSKHGRRRDQQHMSVNTFLTHVKKSWSKGYLEVYLCSVHMSILSVIDS